MTEFSTTPPDDGARCAERKPRDSMLLMGTIKAVGDVARQTQPIRIRNLSATGLMAVSQLEYDVGSVVEVDLRGIGQVSGEIVWVCGNQLGITFDRKVDPRLARQPIVAGTTINFAETAKR